jgi:hypothetical protein
MGCRGAGLQQLAQDWTQLEDKAARRTAAIGDLFGASPS